MVSKSPTHKNCCVGTTQAALTNKHQQLAPFIHVSHELSQAVFVLSVETAIGQEQHQLARRPL